MYQHFPLIAPCAYLCSPLKEECGTAENRVSIPLLQHPPLKHQVVKLTPMKHAVHITHLAHSHLDEWAEIPTATPLVLDLQLTSGGPQILFEEWCAWYNEQQ